MLNSEALGRESLGLGGQQRGLDNESLDEVLLGFEVLESIEAPESAGTKEAFSMFRTGGQYGGPPARQPIVLFDSRDFYSCGRSLLKSV